MRNHLTPIRLDLLLGIEIVLVGYRMEVRFIRYVLVFLLLYFFRGFFVYSPPPVHVYI
jgi:hypothetical protein